MSKKTKLDDDFLEDASETLRVMAHPIRLSIIEVLHQQGEQSVTKIYQELEIEQAVASHHLRILKGKKIVSVRRDGQHSIYSLGDADYYGIVELMKKLK
ncbi:MAG: ArsR/SmtB family transcription factor [Saprospiraceae bacterium]